MEKKLNSPKVPVTESSSFEKLMTACLEKKTPTKKGTTKKPLKEKVVKKSTILEEFADEFDSDFKDDFESDMPDIQDDVLVIVDPEMDPEDVKDAAAEAQAIIDGTEEGEIPSTDKYIDDFTYTCPRCGNTFPSEQELSEGDACPVCDDTPEAFVMVGQIKEADVEAEFADEFDEEEPKEKKKPIKFGRYFSFHEPDLLDFNILKNQAENPEKTKREKGYMVEIIKEETIYSGSQNILRKYVEYRVLSFKKNKTNGGF
jgi:rubrerythrin